MLNHRAAVHAARRLLLRQAGGLKELREQVEAGEVRRILQDGHEAQRVQSPLAVLELAERHTGQLGHGGEEVDHVHQGVGCRAPVLGGNDRAAHDHRHVHTALEHGALALVPAPVVGRGGLGRAVVGEEHHRGPAGDVGARVELGDDLPDGGVHGLDHCVVPPSRGGTVGAGARVRAREHGRRGIDEGRVSGIEGDIHQPRLVGRRAQPRQLCDGLLGMHGGRVRHVRRVAEWGRPPLALDLDPVEVVGVPRGIVGGHQVAGEALPAVHFGGVVVVVEAATGLCEALLGGCFTAQLARSQVPLAHRSVGVRAGGALVQHLGEGGLVGAQIRDPVGVKCGADAGAPGLSARHDARAGR